jgi:hypothetical protein
MKIVTLKSTNLKGRIAFFLQLLDAANTMFWTGKVIIEFRDVATTPNVES